MVTDAKIGWKYIIKIKLIIGSSLNQNFMAQKILPTSINHRQRQNRKMSRIFRFFVCVYFTHIFVCVYFSMKLRTDKLTFVTSVVLNRWKNFPRWGNFWGILGCNFLSLLNLMSAYAVFIPLYPGILFVVNVNYGEKPLFSDLFGDVLGGGNTWGVWLERGDWDVNG